MTATAIEWTEQVWNPVVGCTVHSPGCTNCYAMKMAHRLQAMAIKPDGSGNVHLSHYLGTTQKVRGNPVWTGKLGFSESAMLAPVRRRKPTRYFVNSMSDLFHKSVPQEMLLRIYAVMIATPQHTYQVLTKRSDRMRQFVQWICDTEAGSDALCEAVEEVEPEADLDFTMPPENVWLGVSAEDQTRWDERTADLRQTPAAVRWVSAEPLLGLIRDDFGLDGIDWVVAGGESGPNARPMHPDWARSLRDQCASAGVPFFFKQWGVWVPLSGSDGFWPHNEPGACRLMPDGEKHPRGKSMQRVGKKTAGRLLDGIEHNAMPGSHLA
jgi:protein gp37